VGENVQEHLFVGVSFGAHSPSFLILSKWARLTVDGVRVKN
jgi:hypothetical protein